MNELLNIIDSEDVQIATGRPDGRGRHMNLDKEAVKANLKSKKQIEEIANKLKVRKFQKNIE